MNRRQFLLGSAGLVGSGAVGSIAYTSASAQREVDVRVEADDNANAALRLEPGPAGGTEIRGSQLAITGVADDKYTTPDGSFVFGDDSDPTSVYAFRMTNNLADAREFTLTTDAQPESASMGVSLFDASGNNVGSSASTVSTVTGDDIVVETTASIPGDTAIDLTVYEDTNPSDDSATVNEETVSLGDGTNTYSLSNIEFDDGHEIWFEAEFTTDSSTDEDPALSEVTLRNEGGNQVKTVDSTGQVVPLDPGQVAYAILTIGTPPDGSNVTGTLEISTSANESFS